MSSTLLAKIEQVKNKRVTYADPKDKKTLLEKIQERREDEKQLIKCMETTEKYLRELSKQNKKMHELGSQVVRTLDPSVREQYKELESSINETYQKILKGFLDDVARSKLTENEISKLINQYRLIRRSFPDDNKIFGRL